MINKKNLYSVRIIVSFIMFGTLWMLPIIKAETELIGEIELNHTFLSDNEAFTQGLELNDDQLIMGTGLYGDSAIGLIDLETGEFAVIETLPDNFFGEGITFTPSYLWQLTWKENTAFKRDPQTFTIIDEIVYEGEGWGIAYDESREVLWMSDGSDILTIRDPVNFDVMDELKVTLEGRPIDNINELEFVEGAIYANLWQTNQIIKINLDSGEVEKTFDFTGIIEATNMTDEEREQLDVLNGIAHIEGQRFYITGKKYPVIYEVELNE